MELIHTSAELLERGAPPAMRERGTVCCVGVFDGVHLGHRYLIERMEASARELDAAAFLLTFGNHPLSVLAPPYAPKMLMSAEEKRALLEREPVDCLAMIDFDARLAAVEHRAFVEGCLFQKCGMRKIVCGYDFRFGHDGLGNRDTLAEMGERLGFEVEVRPKIKDHEREISSSAIRGLLSVGHVAEAASMLGRDYRLDGEVVEGKRRGRTIGFPTINLRVDPRRLVPGPGVYAVRMPELSEREGRPVIAMMNIGGNPTFQEQELKLEAHILDWDADLYGQRVAVEFVERLRDVEIFDGVETLIAQLQRDLARTREVFAR